MAVARLPSRHDADSKPLSEERTLLSSLPYSSVPCWIASILVAVATVGQRIQSDLRDLEGVLLCSQHSFMSLHVTNHVNYVAVRGKII